MYTIGTHNVARAHAPHCAAAESDFGLCPTLSLAGLLAHSVHRRYAQSYRTYSFNELLYGSFHVVYFVYITETIKLLISCNACTYKCMFVMECMCSTGNVYSWDVVFHT